MDAFGMDASRWDDNDYSLNKNAVRVGNSNIYVQDNYGERDADTKLLYFTAQFPMLLRINIPSKEIIFLTIRVLRIILISQE